VASAYASLYRQDASLGLEVAAGAPHDRNAATPAIDATMMVAMTVAATEWLTGDVFTALLKRPIHSCPAPALADLRPAAIGRPEKATVEESGSTNE